MRFFATKMWELRNHKIMQALHISPILCGNRPFLQWKCGIFEKQPPLHNIQALADYALNKAIA